MHGLNYLKHPNIKISKALVFVCVRQNTATSMKKENYYFKICVENLKKP